VWARNAGSSAAYDAWRSASFTASVPSSLTITDLAPDAPGSVPAGTPVTWSATAVGGTAPYTYRFWVFDGSTWTLARDWAAQNSFTWTPALAGSYSIQVWARNSGSATAYDAWLGRGYTATGAAALTVSSLAADRMFPVPAGTPVRWTATASGGNGPYTFRFWVFNGSTWTVGQDWGSSNVWPWVPPAAGSYSFQVWARNSGSAATYDAWLGTMSNAITAPTMLSVTNVTSNPGAPLVANGTAAITATASGGTGPYTYRYWIFNGSTWTIGQDWSASNVWNWKPTSSGTYTIQVWVRNTGSATTYDAWAGFGPITVQP